MKHVLCILFFYIFPCCFIIAESDDARILSIKEALHSPYLYQSVNVITGEYCENATDFEIKGSAPLILKRCYTTQDPVAHGWHFNHPNVMHSLGNFSGGEEQEKLQYAYDAANRLSKITVNAQHAVHFNYLDGETPQCEVSTDLGHSLLYTFMKYSPSRALHPYLLEQVKDASGWEVNYQYSNHPYERRQLMKKREEPDGRYLITEYYDSTANNVGGKIVLINDPPRDPRIGKVKLQKAPVGVDSTPIIIGRYFYDTGSTETYDALGNKTVYRYNVQEKLTSIEHYWNENTLYRKERLFWNTIGQLAGRCLEDGEGKTHMAHTFAYDAFGNLTHHTLWGDLSGTRPSPFAVNSQGTPLDSSIENYSTRYLYSSDGKQLLSENSDDGIEIRYTYHEGRVEAKLLSFEGVIKTRQFYRYDASGHLFESILDDGESESCDSFAGTSMRRITRYEQYNLSGLPEKVEELCLDLVSGREILVQQAFITYSPKGEIEEKTLFDGTGTHLSTVTNSFDSKGRLVLAHDSGGHYQKILYDLNGNPLEIEEDEQRIHQVFDFANRVIQKEIEGKGTLNYRYDYAGHQIAVSDQFGNETEFRYDPMGRRILTLLPKVVNEKGETIRPSSKQVYDIFDRAILVSDPKGYRTKTRYSVRGKPTEIQYPDGSREAFEYYLDGSLKKTIQHNGTFAVFHRDYLKRTVQEEHFDKNGKLLGLKSYAYSPFHLISETDFNGNMTEYAYDASGKQIAVKQGYRTLETSYEASGKIKTKKQWYGPHENDFVLGVIENSGVELYDAEGRLLKTSSCEIPEQKTPLASEAASVFNELGQRVRQVNEFNKNGDLTITTFDAIGRVVKIEKKNGLGTTLSSKSIRYDASGNKARETHLSDASSLTTAWEWGPNNRLEKTIEGFGSAKARTTTYLYSPDTTLESIIKPDGVVLSFTYNPAGQTETLTSSDQTIAYRYHYDEAGRMIRADDLLNGTATCRSYDAMGHLNEETLGNGLCFTNTYDLMGRRTSLILPDASEIRWQYNAAFMTAVERYGTDGALHYAHAYTEFDLQGRAVMSEMIGSLGTIHYVFQGAKIEAIQSPFWSQRVEYDALNRIATATFEDPQGVERIAYAYDEKNQIQQEAERFYAYDGRFNLISNNGAAFHYDELNQLLSAGSLTFQYDPNGQMLESREKSTQLSYVYDALGRLTQINEGGKRLLQFTYDAFGRRLSKKGDGSLTLYLWDGENEIGAVDQAGCLTALRVLGNGLGAEIGAAVALEIEGKVYAPLHDIRGSVCCLVDCETHQAAEWYRYTAFGEVTRYGESTGNPWGFSSKRLDEETGLIYFGKRYYLPSIGRWISQDPLGTPESFNRYAYALNQPLSRIDPQGLFSFGELWDTLVNELQSLSISGYQIFHSLKNKLNFDDFIRPTLGQVGEAILGGGFLQLAGFYQDASESGVHGKAELNDKVRITLVNGILNARADYKQSISLLSETHGGVNVHYIFDATQGWTGDMLRAFLTRFGYTSPVAYQLADTWRELIDEMGGTGNGGLIIHYAHSIGSAHTKAALNLLTPEERQMIRVYTFGSPSMVDSEGLESAMNFANYRDGVSLLDPLGYLSGLFGFADNVALVGSPFGIPFIEHTFNSGAYYQIMQLLGIHFLNHYVGQE